jgi:acetylglutamate kinase
MHIADDLKSLRTAIPYIRAYKGRTFVVKIGGALCRPGSVLNNIVDQLALLYQLGIKLVVVHGGGPQADELTETLGFERKVVGGRRVTDDTALDTVKMAFAGTVNTDFLAACRRAHLTAVGVSGIDGQLITARRRPPVKVTDPETQQERMIDYGHVGDIESVSIGVVRHMLDGGVVPVICSLAADRDGNVLNVNADTIAARMAVELKAAKYFLVTNVDGVLRNVGDSSTLYSFLKLGELRELIDSGVVSGGMLPKISACVDAIRGGVQRVHIINGNATDALLGEVFTNEGCGTLIVDDSAAGDPAVPQAADK